MAAYRGGPARNAGSARELSGQHIVTTASSRREEYHGPQLNRSAAISPSLPKMRVSSAISSMVISSAPVGKQSEVGLVHLLGCQPLHRAEVDCDLAVNLCRAARRSWKETPTFLKPSCLNPANARTPG